MSEAGEIPANEASTAKVEDEKQDDGDAMVVVAAAVVDDNDEDGSTGSGSVVVAKIVDDEEPPTPNTSKVEADLAQALPAASLAGEKKSTPPKKPETEVTPVKRNLGLAIMGKDKTDTGDKSAEVQVKTVASSEKKEETTIDAEALPTKDPADKAVSPPKEAAEKSVVNEAEAPMEKKSEEPKPDEKPPAEIVSAKNAGVEEAKPMETEVPSAAKDKQDDDTDEEGEIKEEEGEVEEGEIGDVPAADQTKTPVTKTEKPEEKQVAQDEGQAKKDSPKAEKEDTKPSPSEEDKDKPEKKEEGPTPMEVDEPKPKDSPKKETPSPIVDAPPAPEKADDKKDDKGDDDEDGEIKEDTEEEGEIKEDAKEEGELKDDTDEEGEVKEDVVKKEAVKEDVKKDVAKVAPKEYVEMDDALSQSEEGGDRDADMASTADGESVSNDGDTASLVDEPTSKRVEPTYSTRGRSSGSNTPVPQSIAKGSHASASGSSGGRTEQWERSVREALEDLGRTGKDAPPGGVGPGGASFLEALGEEERRTRTRFLPAVDGIHMLRKNEIKGDLAMARSIMSNSGNVASVASVAAGAAASSAPPPKKSKKKKHHHDSSGGEAEAMDTDDGGVLSSSEDDPGDLARIGSGSSIEVEPGDILMVPSTAFVPPPAATYSSAPPAASNGEKNEDGTPAPVVSTGVKGILNNQRNIKSPKVVESVMAFNPPRPPESVGKKKQHRMLRWERRPADVEVDLNNYRKTVDRTRKELHTAEDELERIEATSNHLRRHFLGHLQCMDQESDKILTELDTVQQECVTAADLLTSRTRSRGAGKGSCVMRDVLSVLKARGSELNEKGIDLGGSKPISKDAEPIFGMGGVGGSSFADLNQHSLVSPQIIASAWVLPGDKVTTPYGEGSVVKIFKNAAPNTKEPPLEGTLAKSASNGESPSKMDIDTPTASGNAEEKAPSPKSGGQKSGASKGAAGKKKGPSGPSAEELSSFVGTRICVRLPFGVGYFSPAVVASTETPSTLTDAQLAKRWGGIIESALSQAGKLDLNGMALLDSGKKQKLQASTSEGATSEGAAPMDVDNANGGATTDPDTDGTSESLGATKKLLPFGSRLLPTGTGRGNELSEMNAQKLQKALKPALTEGEGVLGDPANEGVPTIVKDFEVERQESYILQAKVLQLRNELYRQRRIRVLNERTFQATRDRSTRVESLVSEMRTDLKSLRNRLDEELVELGIDQDRAEAILKSYYLSQDYAEHHEADEEDDETTPPHKRARSGEGTDEMGEEPGEDQKSDGTDVIERETKRAKVAAQ